MIKELKIPNGLVSYYSLGKGSPLIMLNGYGGHFYAWPIEFKKELSRHFEVFFINYREMGYSTSRDNQFTIPLLAQDIYQFIHELKLTNVSLLGFSMGGYVAQEFALNYSENLNLFILCATKLGGHKFIPNDPEILKKFSPSSASLEDEIESDLKLNFPLNEIERYREAQRERLQCRLLPETFITAEIKLKQQTAISRWIDDFKEEKYAKYAKINSKKNLIIAGLQDIIIPYQNSIVLSHQLQNSQTLFFDMGGHGILNQYPKEIAEFICSQS